MGGFLVGAATGILSGAVALGIATFVAAFVRPQASPVIAVGEAAIDRTPPAVKNFAVQHFGTHDKFFLLTGIYVVIALIAVVIGWLARRSLMAGMAGIGLFGAFGAFVELTRPESRTTDAIPALVGGVAGIVAMFLLVQSARPEFRASAARRTREYYS